MNNHLKFLILIMGIFISFFISIMVWNNISFSYSHYERVEGFYFDNNLSHHNNLIKFLSFITIPILLFNIFLYKLYYQNNILTIFFKPFKKDNINVNKIAKLILFSFLLIVFINFLSKDIVIRDVDYFHEGLTLSAAFTYLQTGELWNSSFLSNSLFSDIYSATIAWSIFDSVSIGSYRFFHEILRLFTEVILIFFIYKLSFVYDFNKKIQNIFLISILFLSISINRDLTEVFYPFRYRDIPIFVLLILSIDYLKFNKSIYLVPFLIGFLSIYSLFWSLDRGVYYLISLFFLIFVSFFQKRFFHIWIIILGIAISSLSIYLFFGFSEISQFFYNSITILKNFDIYAGSSYPTIFDFKNNHSSRGTINLFIIVLNGFFVIFFLINKSLSLRNNSKIIILFIFIISCLIYKSALSVPDSYHMKQSIFLNKILFLSNLLYLILNNNFLNQKKIIYVIPFVFLFYTYDNFKYINFNNIILFKDRNLQHIKKDDKNFISLNYLDFKNFILNNYNLNCIQIFSYDAILPYLLKKKSCTKFNFLYSVSSKNVEKKMITAFSEKMPELIIFNKDYNFLSLNPIEKKLKETNNFLKENYKIDKEFGRWLIYKKIS